MLKLGESAATITIRSSEAKTVEGLSGLQPLIQIRCVEELIIHARDFLTQVDKPQNLGGNREDFDSSIVSYYLGFRRQLVILSMGYADTRHGSMRFQFRFAFFEILNHNLSSLFPTATDSSLDYELGKKLWTLGCPGILLPSPHCTEVVLLKS